MGRRVVGDGVVDRGDDDKGLGSELSSGVGQFFEVREHACLVREQALGHRPGPGQNGPGCVAIGRRRLTVLTELGQTDDVRFEQMTLRHHAPSDSA